MNAPDGCIPGIPTNYSEQSQSVMQARTLRTTKCSTTECNSAPLVENNSDKQQQATKKEIKGLTPDHKACSRVLCMLVGRPKHLWSTSPTSNQAWN
jgi:hypothetical protein